MGHTRSWTREPRRESPATLVCAREYMLPLLFAILLARSHAALSAYSDGSNSDNSIKM